MRSLSLPCIAVAATIFPTGRLPAAETPPTLADRLVTVLPSVVSIKTITDRHGAPYYSWGSGFIVAASGMILTNRHVVAGADKITVSGHDIPAQQATVVYISKLLDLAIVKIAAGRDLPALSFADSDGLQVGDPVLAVGSPLGIGISVSAGIVSALNRNIRETDYDDFIQTDAAINHGSSGGTLVNPKGEVVGIDTALESSPNNTGSIGIGFAMPANDAKFVVDQVLKFGHEQAGWAGLQVQRVTQELAEGFGLGATHGVLVSAVDPAGPAGGGRIQVGDVIVGIAGATARGGRQVQRVIAETPVGQTVSVTLLRDGVPQTVSLRIADYPPDRKGVMDQPAEPPVARIALAGPDHLGMRLATITETSRAKYNLAAGQKGVLVVSVNPFGAAEGCGISPGDVITQVGHNLVATPSQVVHRLRDLSQGKADEAALLLVGARGSHWVALQIGAEK
jgi:serine protease Do